MAAVITILILLLIILILLHCSIAPGRECGGAAFIRKNLLTLTARL